MDFRLLGPLEVEADGRAITPTRPRERAVLAFLLLRAGTVVGSEELVEAVWGEEPPPTARTALQGVISSLRRRLGPERIETRAHGYRFVLQPGDRYDVTEFEELVVDAAREGPARRSHLLREALERFRGDPLADVDHAGGVQHQVARLQELRLGAEEAGIGADLELGRHLEVIPRLEQLLVEHPLREELRAQLMLALYRAGRQADALRVAQDARRVLATELGIEPGPALQRLEARILDQDPELIDTSGAAPKPVQGDAGLAITSGTATFLAVHSPSPEPGARQLVVGAAVRQGGMEVSSSRGTVVAFARARDAAAAAAAIQRSARREGPGLRVGLASTGAAHVAAVAHPGQVVLTREVRELLREAPLHEVDVRDLGLHRLADLAPAQALYQLVALGLDVDFPPPAGLEARPTNLPVQSATLIGRGEEIDGVVSLLRDPETRLVTLIGPGGTGKTRLAVHVAAELLDDAPDGAWFVALDSLTDPGLVVPTIAAAMGDGEVRDSVAVLARRERDRRTLLVLDNFEHLLPAAGVVGELLAGTSSLKVLVTSRVPLKVAGERVVPVPPLPAPQPGAESDLDALARIGSVALFVARARAARPEFSLSADNAREIAALCRALDGLPLAVELAASQLGLVPAAGMLDRLQRGLRRVRRGSEPGPDRHRALEAAVEWSHELLDTDARGLFADVAVFAGGWTLDAAESVCARVEDVMSAMATLVDQSLVGVAGTDAEPRFGMLETIRHYAAARLDASGRRADVEARHASHFQGLADSAEPHLRGNPGEWVARLEREHDNLRAAIERLADRGDAAAEARLAGSLWRFWYLAGHLGEGRRRLERAVDVYQEPTSVRVKTLIGAAVMAVNTADPELGRERAEEALRLSRRLADPWSAAYAQFILGAALGQLNDDLGARRAEEASLSAFRELGDEHSALLVSRNLAATLVDLGDHPAAEALYQENLRRARADQNGRLEASTLGALATIAFDAGRIGDARLMLRESLRIHREIADTLDTAVDLARAARVLAISGQPEAAARVVGALSAVREQLGARGRPVTLAIDATMAGISRQLNETALRDLVVEGEMINLADATEVALGALM